MVRTRYIGSTRSREAGYSATPKQDFIAHVSGGDWIHLASNISEIYSGNVQQALNEIYNMVVVLGNVVVGAGPVGSATPVTNGTIPVYDGTSGRTIRGTPTAIESTFGDIVFPVISGGSVISKQTTNLSTQAEPLQIFSQGNSGGQGGNLILGSGYNFVSGLYDGTISLCSSRLAFDTAMPTPHITQNDSAGAPNDLYIISQGTTSSVTPSNLHLESGVNGLGQAGNIYLDSSLGIIDIQASAFSFNPNSSAVITQGSLDTATATSMYIRAQSIPAGAVNSTGVPGNLWLGSGRNENNNVSGNIYLFADVGSINVWASNVVFGVDYAPVISQVTRNLAGSPLTISAQSSVAGIAGDLILTSGHGVWNGVKYDDGNVILNALSSEVRIASSNVVFTAEVLNPQISQKPSSNPGKNMIISAQPSSVGAGGDLLLMAGEGIAGFGNIYLYTPNLLFAATMPGIQIKQPTIDTAGSDCVFSAQTSNYAKGGSVYIYSGAGYVLDPPAISGNDGNINILAGTGQVNIGGTAASGAGSVNLMGYIFFPNTTAPTAAPVNGAYIFAAGGNLYCMGSDGVGHQLNVT